jgi:hypothetical protein
MRFSRRLRGVLLVHRVSPLAADRVAWAAGALGSIAVTITVAQLRVGVSQV